MRKRMFKVFLYCVLVIAFSGCGNKGFLPNTIHRIQYEDITKPTRNPEEKMPETTPKEGASTGTNSGSTGSGSTGSNKNP